LPQQSTCITAHQSLYSSLTRRPPSARRLAPTRSCPPCPKTGGTRARSSSRCGALTSNRSTR
jgi:hypothetical protein